RTEQSGFLDAFTPVFVPVRQDVLGIPFLNQLLKYGRSRHAGVSGIPKQAKMAAGFKYASKLAQGASYIQPMKRLGARDNTGAFGAESQLFCGRTDVAKLGAGLDALADHGQARLDTENRNVTGHERDACLSGPCADIEEQSITERRYKLR